VLTFGSAVGGGSVVLVGVTVGGSAVGGSVVEVAVGRTVVAVAVGVAVGGTVAVPVAVAVGVAVPVAVAVGVAVPVVVGVGVGACRLNTVRPSFSTGSFSGVNGLSGPKTITRMLTGPL
jgi:hypothetical protein